MKGNYPILSFKDIQNINWFIADTIRDKGNGASSDYKSIAVPFIVLKRFLDVREENKRNEKFGDIVFEVATNGNVDAFNNETAQYIANLMPDQRPYVHKDGYQNWWDIEWEDIEAYQMNSANEMQSIKLGSKEDPFYEKRATIQTNAGDRVELLYKIGSLRQMIASV